MSLFIDIVRRIPSIIAPSCQLPYSTTILVAEVTIRRFSGDRHYRPMFFPSKTPLLRRQTSHHPHLVSAAPIHLRPNLAGIPLDSMSQTTDSPYR